MSVCYSECIFGLYMYTVRFAYFAGEICIRVSFSSFWKWVVLPPKL